MRLRLHQFFKNTYQERRRVRRISKSECNLIKPAYASGLSKFLWTGIQWEVSYIDEKGGGINDGVDESWGPKLNGN